MVNSKVLDNMGLELSVKKIQGNILSNIEFNTIELKTKNQFSILTANRLTLSYKLSTLFNAYPEIMGVELDGGVFSYPSSIDTLNKLFSGDKKSGKKKQPHQSSPQIQKEPKTWTFDFGVTNFTFNYENHPIIIPTLFGDFHMIDNDLSVNIDTASVIADKRFEAFNFSRVKIKNSKSGFSIENLHIDNYELDLLAHFNFPTDSTKTITFDVTNINPNHYLPDQRNQFAITDFLNLSGTFEIAYEQHLDLNFNGQLRGNPIEDGKIKLDIHDKLVDVSQFEFTSDDENISAHFFSKNSKKHRGQVSIEKYRFAEMEISNNKNLYYW